MNETFASAPFAALPPGFDSLHHRQEGLQGGWVLRLKRDVFTINQQAGEEIESVTEGRHTSRRAAVAANGLRQVGAGMLEEGGAVGVACGRIRKGSVWGPASVHQGSYH